MVSKPHTKTYTTYNGSATDFLFRIKPNLPRLLGFHQPRVRGGLFTPKCLALFSCLSYTPTSYPSPREALLSTDVSVSTTSWVRDTKIIQ